MSKKISKRVKGILDSMPITRKITLFYGIIFTVSLIIICVFVSMNAAIIFENQIKTQLLNTIYNIKEAAKETSLSDISFESCLDDKYVEFIIKNIDTGEIYTNALRESPEFIGALKLNIIKSIDLNEYNINLDDINSLTHIVNAEDGSMDRIMISQDKFKTENGRYIILAYKFFRDNFENIKPFVINLFILDGICIYIVFMIGKLISEKMLKPIADITKTAERMSIEDLSQRISPPKTDDEVRQLCLTFNSMIERLEESFKKQEQFVSDASHELRTPIAVVQGYAKLLDRWGKNDPVILQESIDSIIAETDHMSVMIKKLLFLAKGDQRKIEIEKEVTELNNIAKAAVKDMNMLDSGKKLEIDLSDDVYIFADGDLIKQLLCIYIENSFKYTADDGTINVKVWHDKNYAYVSVKDTGCGIESSKIPYIFDRFYKADEARSGKIPGTGIGLSIAKWIIDMHNGFVDVKSELNKGTEFITRFNIYK